MSRKTRPLEDRFWQKVDRSSGANGCWLWNGALHGAGYGIIGIGSRGEGVARAHRLSLEWKLGRRLLPGRFACHSCDNRRCVNPAHLWEGSARDNSRDCVEKKRHVVGTQKLTREQALEIRSAGDQCQEAARRFGVSPATVSMIRSGKRWIHLD